MDLVLRLTNADEIPDHLKWLIIERDDKRTVVVVARDIDTEHLCTLWARLTEEADAAAAQQSA